MMYKVRRISAIFDRFPCRLDLSESAPNATVAAKSHKPTAEKSGLSQAAIAAITAPNPTTWQKIYAQVISFL